MKPQPYGAIGIALGLFAFVTGLLLLFSPMHDEIGVILLLVGAFLFGCGLVAAAIGARK